jgi:hypothetical protein
VDGVGTQLFCAWLAWCRFRVVLALLDKTLPSVMAAIDQALRIFGGVPTYGFPDYVARHIIGLLCPTVLCGRSRLIFSGASPARSGRAHNEMARRHDGFLFLSAERKLSPCWRSIL